MDTDLYHNIKTERTTLKRLPERGSHELDTICAILDEGIVCHVGFATERGPVVIPTTYGRVGGDLYLHGSPASRMLRSLKDGVPLCVTVTLVDALVLARSTFHHSINYRSVVVFGTGTEVTDPDEKAEALAAFVEHIVPGRTAEARVATPKEVKGTLVLRLPLTEASAKVRVGPPVDDEEDLSLPVWAGVLPFAATPGVPIADAYVPERVEVPGYIRDYDRSSA
jgi:nitroimidazol reductase NimA-like FMN-containing flavoprotein (pyridoxamine 5'-phosphate oxidase superfamily)